MDINPIIPANFEEKLKTYLRTVFEKKGEINKRNYFVNEVLVKWFNIDPELIEFEENHRDLFVSGVLFETKTYLNEQKRKEAFEELKDYIKTSNKREDIIKAVISDFIQFEIYDPKDVENYTEKEYENIFKMCKESFSLNNGGITPEKHFQNLYKLLYYHNQLLPIRERVIIPKLVDFINRLSKQADEITTNNIKFKAWVTYLSVALGSEKEANIDLFKKYVILYYITILFVAKLLGYKANRDSVISGDIFVAKGIRNFVDQEDFFNILDTKSKVLDEIDQELDNYDFQKISDKSDIFRLLYEELIPPSNRHSLGEFYTPEWLAEYLIDELVTKDNLVLDPACGSGTFLRAAIKKKKELGSENIEKQIIGFDINPIAIIIAKANVLLEFRKGIEIIPVFLADSLMPGLNIKQRRLQEDYININFEEIVEGSGTAKFYYKPNGKDLSPQEMYDYIKRLINLAEEKSKGIDITEKIESNILPNQELIEKLSELISKGKNHLWSFILQNIYNPYYYRDKVDAVIGNPPWLTYKDVESPLRQLFLDTLYLEYGLGSGSGNKTQQDMAEFFIARAKEYIRKSDKEKISDTGKIGFVLTRAIFDSAQYNAIRRAAVSANKGSNNSNNLPRITKIYDITQKANPFRRTSCIVIFDFKNTSNEIDGFIIDSEKKVKINEAPKVILTKTKFYINITKNDSGIGVSKLKNNNINTIYKDEFKNGATIFPRPYYFVEKERKDIYGFVVSCASEYSSKASKRKRKKDWYNFPKDTVVEKHLIYDVITGDTIDKYKYSTKKAVLPIINGNFIFKEIKEGNHYNIGLVDNIDSIIFKLVKNKAQEEIIKKLLQDLSKEPYQSFENNWEKLRGAKFNLESSKQSQKMGILDWLNFNGKLLSQLTRKGKYVVVYNTSGKNVKCCILKEEKRKNPIIIDYECYYYKTNNKLEAYYLEGVLNSDILLKKFLESGLKSERHITKKIFELGIPRFDDNNRKHVEIAECAERINKKKDKKDLERINELVNEIM